MELLEKVREAGVIGAGGAGFPTYVKLQGKADYLLLNGAECEPLLRVDQQLMEYHSDEVIKGLMISLEITGAKKAIIGIKNKHYDVIEILRKTIRKLKLQRKIEIGILPDIYPAGDEQILVYELTGRIVPETGIPTAAGCVVINVETAYNIYHASQDEPVIMKFVTVAGDVPDPMTVKVPIGTPMKDILKLTGRTDFSAYSIIDGGPMMGSLLKNCDGYVTKKTKGLIVLPEDHSLIWRKKKDMRAAVRLNRSACEQCSMCTDLCPRHLLGHSTSPHKMVRAMAYDLEPEGNMSVALTCCQCNLCEYFSCPAGISPKMANVYYMNKLREKGIRHIPGTDFTVNPMREYRLIPSKRLIARLGIGRFDVDAPLMEEKKVEPKVVGIGLKDHVGAPAVPVVAVGDRVSAGRKIADTGKDTLGVPVYASISGIVESIEDNLIIIRRE